MRCARMSAASSPEVSGARATPSRSTQGKPHPYKDFRLTVYSRPPAHFHPHLCSFKESRSVGGFFRGGVPLESCGASGQAARNRQRRTMKKFAFLAAALIGFAGCSRNDTGDMTSAPDHPVPASGTPASRQSGNNSSSSASDSSTSSANSAADPLSTPRSSAGQDKNRLSTNTLEQPNAGTTPGQSSGNQSGQ